jgi:site-specific recombinase XerD
MTFGAVKGQPAANAGKKFPSEPLTASEVNALLAACSAVAPTGIRNRAAIVLMYQAGLRSAEVLALKASDVNPARGTVRVLHGKGNRARTVGLNPGGMAVVQRWAERRRQLGITAGPLVCTLAGGRVSGRYMRALMPRLALKAGVDKRVHPHGLRHTHSTELAAEGVPINVISRQLGHSSSAVTARYVDHIAPSRVIEVMRQRTWTEEGQ